MTWNPYHKIIKLRFFSNALLLPHLGYVTEENYSLFYNQMIENLNSCLEGKPKRIFRMNFYSFWSFSSKEQSSYFWLKLKTFNRS